MIDFLDVPTLVFMSVVVYFTLACVMAQSWWTQRSYPGFGRLTLAPFVWLVGGFSLVGRDKIGLEASVLLVNVFHVVYLWLLFDGQAQFHTVPHRRLYSRLTALVGLVWLFAALWFFYVKPSLNGRVIAASFGMAIMAAAAAGAPLLTRRGRGYSGQWLVSAALLAFSVVSVHRGFHYLHAPEIQNLLQDDPLMRPLLTTVLVVNVIQVFGAISMSGMRLRRDLEFVQSRLKRLAELDPLTKAVNRRFFLISAKKTVRAAERYGRPVGLVMFDVDHFKRVNDEHGHACGDVVLRELCALAQSTLRDVDLLGRLGGEEFAVLMPETDMIGAMRTAERLRSLVAAKVFGTAPGVRATISLGAAVYSSGGVDAFMRAADANLYKAKRAGRNRVVGDGFAVSPASDEETDKPAVGFM